MRRGSHLSLFRAAFLIALICYAVFLWIDFNSIGNVKLSLAAKYTGLLCCVFCAYLGKSRLLFYALALTAICDFFLLFTDFIALGISLFTIVQILHCVRFFLFNRYSVKWIFIPVLLSLGGMISAFYITAANSVMIAAFAYAPALLCAWALSCLAFLRKKESRPQSSYSALGMTLFIACDICVALFNLRMYAAADWIWFFYLPSQWLLAQGVGETTRASGGKLFKKSLTKNLLRN